MNKRLTRVLGAREVVSALALALVAGCQPGMIEGTNPSDAAGDRGTIRADAAAGDAAYHPTNGDAGPDASPTPDATAMDARPAAPDASSADAFSTDVPTMLTGTIWYVRRGGGNRTQCDGLGDAPYSGSGDHQHCAFGDVRYLWADGSYGNKAWVISGGDTVIVRDGPWRVGQNGPNSGDSFGNDPGDPFGAGPPPVPSGTAEHPTRIYGEHWASCTAKTQLFGGFAVSHVLSLAGSHHVEVSCLELTDHAQCTRVGSPALPSECSSSFPLDDYAGNGIVTDHATADVTLRNLDLHGFVSRGIIGAIGGLVVVDDVRVAFNAAAGWDFDDGTRSAPGARVDAHGLVVEWSGCNEEYPIRHAVPAISCYDQDHAGYGDGIGTPDTQLDFSCDNCTFRYNTQDGLDLLHTSGSSLTVTHSQSYGNMGQEWKFGAMATVVFRNNLTVHNCRRLSAPFPGAPDGYNSPGLSLFCRAAGDGIAMTVSPTGNYQLEFNTIVAYGATTIDMTCGGPSCSGATMRFQNNIVYGYQNPATGDLPGMFYSSGFTGPLWTTIDHNIYYHTRTCPTDIDPTAQCVDPQLASTPMFTGESSLDTVDMHLAAGSPAIAHGVRIDGVTDDFARRPRASTSSIGAYEP